MSLHIEFNNIKNSEAVTNHIEEQMDELVKITDNKFPFHIHLTNSGELYQVLINCSYKGKALASKSSQDNLYKAISKCVSAMKVQVLRKSERARAN